MKRGLIVLLVGLILALSSAVSASPSRTSSPPGGLTRSGRVLWNFEALLHDTFGAHYKGCLRALSRYVLTFTKDSYCATHASYQTRYYFFTFAHPAGSAFHLVKRTFPRSGTTPSRSAWRPPTSPAIRPGGRI
jgi:hypothetical protein